MLFTTAIKHQHSQNALLELKLPLVTVYRYVILSNQSIIELQGCDS